MITAFYSITPFAPYYYSVHILEDGIYAGVGRFCETEEEMMAFCKHYNVQELRRDD